MVIVPIEFESTWFRRVASKLTFVVIRKDFNKLELKGLFSSNQQTIEIIGPRRVLSKFLKFQDGIIYSLNITLSIKSF